jgi:IS30 family transposase
VARAGEVVRLLKESGFERGVQTQIAKELGVHRSTITRDVQRAILADGRPCPSCEQWVSDKHWNRLRKERKARWRGRGANSDQRPSIWLELAIELRNRGLLPEQDEVPVEDDLSSILLVHVHARGVRV